MDKDLKKRIKYGKTTDEILPDALNAINAGAFPDKDTDKKQDTKYKQLRTYKARHKQGRLGAKGREVILSWFGYKRIELWVKKSKND